MTASEDGEADGQDIYENVWRKVAPSTDYPVDMRILCREMGVDCFSAELSDETSGALVMKLGVDPVIILNQADSVVRQRFTAAHELGHYMKRMAYPGEAFEVIDHRKPLARMGTDPVEIYCNSFAAALLMPAHFVRAEWKATQNIATMAYRFGVSVDAMSFRLRNLGLWRGRT